MTEINRINDQKFQNDLERLSNEAEALRFNTMAKYQSRTFLATGLSIIIILLCAGGFGWFLLMEAQAAPAFLFIIICLISPLMLHSWAEGMLKTYRQLYKREFLPKLAKLLGGLSFHPKRGISAKVINRTGILPSHTLYEAEDCFMGMYKGVKVIFSEARLYRDKRKEQKTFEGVFVLLEAPQDKFTGHTIISANADMVRRYTGKRWKKLSPVAFKNESAHAGRFQMVSSNVEAAQDIASPALLKELAEAADIFDKAPLSAAFFAKKYVFMMIPYAHDMFEPSSLHMPIQTSRHAVQCKREIDQILEIVDVFDLYRPNATAGFNEV
ncbi:MAG: DUF3137 domain-containing protein [Alphaproteobacteria bacterium]